MRRLIPYVLGMAAAAVAGYLYVYFLAIYVESYYSLADGHPSGWAVLFLLYFAGTSGAVGGLLGLVVASKWAPHSGRGLALAQGIIATVAPVLVAGLAMDLSVAIGWLAGIAVCALAGAVGAVLSFGFYIARRELGALNDRV